MLELQNLSKAYPNGTKALDNVCFTVDQPQVLAIIGPSGAGKSTLIRCINRLVEPTSGRALLHGTDVCTLNKSGLRKIRRRIGMIFQEYNLVERLTVMENVLSGRLGYVGFWTAYRRKYPAKDIRAAFELLERVGLAGTHNSRADALSGGQRQRVGIARAVIQAPDLLLVDEPTASLDPKTSRQIMRILVELAHERNTPTLINIHDVSLAHMFSDRMIGLCEGKIVFDGPSNQITPEVLTRIYGEEDWSTTIKKENQEESTPASETSAGNKDLRGEAATG